MSSIFWTLDRIAEGLADRANINLPRGSASVRGITTDTRSIQQGDVFLALKGERFDGHDYLTEAVKKGAAAVIVSQTPKIGDLNIPVYIVDDTLLALGDLGRYWRRAWGGGGKTVVAVAGSNGKTSTKELIKAALSGTLDVHATTGNLNNRIGVPLTLLALPSDADVAVIELGTNLPGEVEMLRAMAEPQITVVTSVAEEHLEGLGDLAGVLREEVSSCANVEVAITPASQAEIAGAAKPLAKRVVSAGLDNGDFAPASWSMSTDGTGILKFSDVEVHVPLRGAHNLRNAMLALAVAAEVGVPLRNAAQGIASMPSPKMRVAFEKAGNLTIINDAYNSNPGSARAALELLQATGQGSSQRVVILGTMRELGSASDRMHDDIAAAAIKSGADIIAGIGEFGPAFKRLGNSNGQVIVANDVEDLWSLLAPKLKPDATILLKASRGVQLERILPFLTDWASKHC